MARTKTRIKTIPQTFLENPEISLGAKGLFALLNTKDIAYKIDIHDLATDATNTEEEIVAFLGEIMKSENIQFLEDGTFILIENIYRKERILDIENIKKIIHFWNSKGVIKVRKETPMLLQRIERTLRIFSYEEIVQGITNYDKILNSPLTWWEYKWTLDEFLKREGGLQVFIDKDEKDYLDRGIIKKNPQARAMVEKEYREKEQEREAEENKKAAVERRSSAEKKQQLIDAWHQIPIDHREIIDANVMKKMKKYENLRYSIPKLWEDSRQQVKLKEIEVYLKDPQGYENLDEEIF